MRRFVLAVAIMLGISAITRPACAGTPHQISWDNRSIKIDGQRVFIWSGEMHPFRLPSPGLWRDVLQKMKAMGFNTVTYYIPWGYFTPKRGIYDFSGIRDVDRA